ncbi:MAG TPA: hypothetical protein VEI45_26020, partial [Mycobacterium sp.]|uniref:hypothetical protein n=1 Tax=Mycobacterium sp. TaxID=1785 RepID=UPI002D241BB0
WANPKSEKPDKQNNNHTHTRGSARCGQKNNNKKTKPPNTLLSSQTTPSGRAASPAAFGR